MVEYTSYLDIDFRTYNTTLHRVQYYTSHQQFLRSNHSTLRHQDIHILSESTRLFPSYRRHLYFACGIGAFSRAKNVISMKIS